MTLINDLLDIAKIEAQTVELEHISFSMHQLMHEVVSMMAVQAKEKGLSFTSEDEGVKSQTFIGDPTRIRQIIVNLCSNALKFTARGNVHVAITSEASGNQGFENVCISVTDSGIGIANDKLDAVFQKFVQGDTSINRKYGGTGLGLSITKMLTETMGGSISVKSTLNIGSTFEVRLPLETTHDQKVDDKKTLKTTEPVNDAEQATKYQLLLVEDYLPNVLVATTFLEEFGYEVDVASNGHEAFDMVRNKNYAVALMDVQMHGMNGLDATAEIRKYEKQHNKPKLYIVGMTAHALAGDRERCLSAGMDDYISKPFNPEELEDRLKKAVSR